MVMQDKVTIDGIDVTSYRIKWATSEVWNVVIDSCTVELSINVRDAITITPSKLIVITRGFTTSTDEVVFSGQITQVKPQTSVVYLVCKGRMYDSIKSAQIKSWDKDIDTEAGVGSEIFKTICDNSGLSYSDASIPTTGAEDLITKFIQNDEDDFQKMNELAEIYNRIISYNYDDELVEFKDKGYVSYPVALRVGTEIPGQIKWKENMEQMINKVKIQGATVYDKIVEDFAGPATTFTLRKTPEDTQVYDDWGGADNLLERGVKDLGTIGTDFDYYVDTEQKTITFAGDKSDVHIIYGAQVPMPITLRNKTSINTYGGPNKKPHFKKIELLDIKDVADAEARGRAILAKYSTPFNEASKVPVISDIIETNGNFKPGYFVQVIDIFNEKDLTVFVKEVIKSWPHVSDKISIGDDVWRTEDWQASIMEKINQLFNELNKNQDILIEVIDFNRSLKYERRYMELQMQNAAGDVGIYGHPTFGVYGTAEYGDQLSGGFILGHNTFGVLGTSALGSGSTSPVTVKLTQGNNTYKEFVYDTDFYDDSNSTDITWDTTNHSISFDSDSSILYSNVISLGTTHTYFTLAEGSKNGNLTWEISGDGKSTWQSVTLDTRTAFASADGDGVYLKGTAGTLSLFPIGFPIVFYSATVENTYKDGGAYDEPALKLTLEE